eukprot:s2101_g17.t1
MTFEGYMRNLLVTPGWHLSIDRKTPSLVVTNSMHYKDGYPQVKRVDFPFRSTIILNGHIWEVVEVADRAQHENEIEECNGELPTEKERKDEAAMERQGFGWHGRSLEDGVYEVEDSDAEDHMGVQPQEGDQVGREPPAVGGPEEEAEEIEINGTKYTAETALSKLREALKRCGWPRGKGKADAWKRLVHYHSTMPTTWQSSLDYCFTRGLKEPDELDKEDLCLHGGDVRGGVSLVVTDDFTHGVMVVPVPGKGKAHLKYLAEQLIRFITERSFSTCTAKADGEPAMRLLLEITQKARQKLGFRTMVEFSGPGGSQAKRADFHIIATSDGLRWTRSIRRMPVAFDAETLSNVRTWPWIGTKATPPPTKVEGAPLPPALAGPIRAEEKEERKKAVQERRRDQPALQDQQPLRHQVPLRCLEGRSQLMMKTLRLHPSALEVDMQKKMRALRRHQD